MWVEYVEYSTQIYSYLILDRNNSHHLSIIHNNFNNFTTYIIMYYTDFRKPKFLNTIKEYPEPM